MDQLKEQLAGVMKYGFWILCGVTVVGALGLGYMGTSSLIEERDAQISKLDQDKSTVTSISNEVSTHPNDTTAEQMDQLIAAVKQDVLDSWEQQYARQKELLKWPVESLGADFVEVFEQFEPIELKVEYPTEQEAAPGLLTRYRDYIGNVLPDIAEIAGAEWTAEFNNPAGGAYGAGSSSYGSSSYGPSSTYDSSSSGSYGSSSYGSGSYGSGSYGSGSYGSGGYGGAGYGGPMMGPGGMPLKEPPLVQWERTSQETLLQNLFPWRGKDPTTLDVLYSQENLWVLTELMKVISTVNGEAKQPFQATIRKINTIAIGKAASSLSGGPGASMYGSYGSYGSGGSGYGPSDPYGSPDSYGPSSGGAYGSSGAAKEAPDPADNRYVDKNFDPIEAETLRSAMASSNPEDAYLAVAKRLPVRINVRMDQRKIPELVAACGNADFMIEVRQVRVNPRADGMGANSAFGSVAAAGSGGAASSGSASYGSAAGSSGSASYGSSSYPSSSGPSSTLGYSGTAMDSSSSSGGYGMGTNPMQQEFPNDIDVEIAGIAYIYNPPNIDALGSEKVDASTVVEGDTETIGGEAVAVEAPTTAPVAPPIDPEALAPGDVDPNAPQGTAPGQPAPGQPGPVPPGPSQPAPADGQAPPDGQVPPNGPPNGPAPPNGQVPPNGAPPNGPAPPPGPAGGPPAMNPGAAPPPGPGPNGPGPNGPGPNGPGPNGPGPNGPGPNGPGPAPNGPAPNGAAPPNGGP